MFTILVKCSNRTPFRSLLKSNQGRYKFLDLNFDFRLGPFIFIAKVWNGWWKSFNSDRIFYKVAKYGFKKFSRWKCFLYTFCYHPNMFSIRKNHKINLIWFKVFLLKRFTKLVKSILRGRKAKKSHLSNLPFLFCPNPYQSTILHLVKTLSLYITCRKVMITYCRTKSYQFKNTMDWF